jgi:hypothetical protein
MYPLKKIESDRPFITDHMQIRLSSRPPPATSTGWRLMQRLGKRVCENTTYPKIVPRFYSKPCGNSAGALTPHQKYALPSVHPVLYSIICRINRRNCSALLIIGETVTFYSVVERFYSERKPP